MVSIWSSFSKTGSPGWSKYDVKDKVIKELNTTDSLLSGNDPFWAARTAYTATVIEAVQKM